MITIYKKSTATSLVVGLGLILLEIGISELIEKHRTYDKNGFDKDGFDRKGFSRDGYNNWGLDCHGYGRDSFDSCGYGKDGFDTFGFDKKGYNVLGFDQEGFDRGGYDDEGYNRNGFNINRFNRNGYDWEGYGKDKYNILGTDRAGYTRQKYVAEFEKLHSYLNEAYEEMRLYDYRHSLFDTRCVFEEILKLVVSHSIGPHRLGENTLENLKICEQKKLLGEDNSFIDKLHGVRKICNLNTHELTYAESISHDQVHFTIMQTKDLMAFAEISLAS
ncbi:hypothetical protein [Acetobacterium malicum]|uniref:hypothetical protein n=1 Tax=Acetobacterium malicum TaxID=52692 RepID=UPI00164C25C2|nr:hypothetical protein [Acetobacterium malicum]